MTCEGVGCSCAAGNAGCASGENCSFYAVSPAGAKFDDRPAGGGCGYSRCFAGDEGLEVQDRQEAGLDELGLCNWSCNSEQRFARKEDRTFWQRPNIAREVEPPEKVIEARLNVSKYWQIAEEGDFLGGEVNVFKGIETLFETRSDEIVAIAREMTHKELESGAGLEAVLNVACRHREFVEVSEEPGERLLGNIICHRLCQLPLTHCCDLYH